jgi:hypothetical protein
VESGRRARRDNQEVCDGESILQATSWFGLYAPFRHGVDACRPHRRDRTGTPLFLTLLRQCPPAGHFHQGLPRRQPCIHGVPSRQWPAPPTLAQLRVVVIELHHVVIRRQRRPLRHQLPVHRRIGRNPRLQPRGFCRKVDFLFRQRHDILLISRHLTVTICVLDRTLRQNPRGCTEIEADPIIGRDHGSVLPAA